MANGDPESSINDGSPVSLVGPTLNRYLQRRYGTIQTRFDASQEHTRNGGPSRQKRDLHRPLVHRKIRVARVQRIAPDVLQRGGDTDS
jgi:hypothetical protein